MQGALIKTDFSSIPSIVLTISPHTSKTSHTPHTFYRTHLGSYRSGVWGEGEEGEVWGEGVGGE